MLQTPDAETIQGLIGRTVHHLGQTWRIVEFLEDERMIVLQATGTDRVIQTDQHGDARRRVPQCLTIQVCKEDGRTPHPDFLALRFTSAQG